MGLMTPAATPASMSTPALTVNARIRRRRLALRSCSVRTRSRADIRGTLSVIKGLVAGPAMPGGSGHKAASRSASGTGRSRPAPDWLDGTLSVTAIGLLGTVRRELHRGRAGRAGPPRGDAEQVTHHGDTALRDERPRPAVALVLVAHPVPTERRADVDAIANYLLPRRRGRDDGPDGVLVTGTAARQHFPGRK